LVWLLRLVGGLQCLAAPTIFMPTVRVNLAR